MTPEDGLYRSLDGREEPSMWFMFLAGPVSSSRPSLFARSGEKA